MSLTLHNYGRSGAAWRVRIALNLKKIEYAQVTHNLLADEQRAPDYVALAPQGLVPAMEADGVVLTQSLAIIEWLEERWPEPPLLPRDPNDRALVRAMADLIACDIHPLNNLRVRKALKKDLGADEAALQRWAERWISDGLGALETLVARYGAGFAFGDRPTIADCCIVPQIGSAQRFGVALDAFPRLLDVAKACAALPPFAEAHPDRQRGSNG